MSGLTLQHSALQTTAFSPRLQYAVKLLQMSSLDYAQTLYEEALSNPFLDMTDPVELPSRPPAEAAALAEGPSGEVAGDAYFSSTDHLPEEWYTRRSTGTDDDAPDAWEGMAVPTTLKSHLHSQIGVLRLTANERVLAQAVVEGLDDDGYLRVALDDIAAVVNSFDSDELQVALYRVQSLEPLGVGARSVGECLALQLRNLPDSPLRTLCLGIVQDHIDALACGNLARLARLVGAPVDSTRAAVDVIRGLDPHPGWRYGDARVQSITPDVTVRKVRGQWTAELNKFALPRVVLNISYVEMLARAVRQGKHPAMASCLERARWTLNNVNQRGTTILAVTRAIATRQKLFLEHGTLALKPLGLREIADEVGVHASTVSRTAHGKYIATPHGVFEMRYFFSRGLEHAAGGASAPAAVQELMREMIDAEARLEPLSDPELARLLARQGFSIARRTVAKYRMSLGILPAESRRGA